MTRRQLLAGAAAGSAFLTSTAEAQSQAPNDPSCARLLASAFKATGKYADAEEVLVMAMAIKSENDVLTAELRNDLAEVRRLIKAADRGSPGDPWWGVAGELPETVATR